MISHVVMLCLKPNHDPQELSDVMQGLASLKLEGFVEFSHGTNLDLEAKSPQHPYGFICAFTDRAAVKRYAENADHIALGSRLVALCEGGADGIYVVDLEHN